MLNNFHDFHNGLKLLCGRRQPRFESESLLRQFQFKMWLRSRTGYYTYSQSGKLFVAKLIDEELEFEKEREPEIPGRKISPANRLIKCIRNNKKIINSVFGIVNLLDSTYYLDYKETVARSYLDNIDIIALNKQTLIQMRLYYSGVNPSKTKAWDVYGLFEKDRENYIGRNALIDINRNRGHQQCYLFASEARGFQPWIADDPAAEWCKGLTGDRCAATYSCLFIKVSNTD